MRRVTSALALLFSAALCTNAFAQPKPALTPVDYGKFETLGFAGPRGGLSPDGTWIAYPVSRSSRDNELRIRKIGEATDTVVAFGSSAAFSDDSKWLAYAIGMPELDREKLVRDKKPVQSKLGLMSLATGDVTTIEGIESFSFDGTGRFLAMRRYAPERPAGAPAANADEPGGTTLIVRTLAAGTDASFGNVNEFAWQDEGSLLAMAISASDKTGNGLQLLDASTSVLRVLDSGASIYSMLAWREESADLAGLKSRTDEKREGPTHALLGWTGLGTAGERRHAIDPAAADGALTAGTRIVAARRPSWSKDGRIVFAGVAAWDEKPEKTDGEKKTADDTVDVNVWHPKDAEVMPLQQKSAPAIRRRNVAGAWHLDADRFVKLGDVHTETITPLDGRSYALVQTWTPYAMQRSIGRGAVDLSLVDLATASRTPLRQNLRNDYIEVSPGGRYIVYLEKDQFWTIDTETKAVANITRGARTSFVDRGSDVTVPQKPAFGIAGWTKNDRDVLVYDEFDIWRVSPDGSAATALTRGAADSVRHRLIKLDADEDVVDLDKPAYVQLFGIWTKASGLGVMENGRMTRAVWMDKSVARLAKADKAGVFAYVVQAYDDPADIFVGGPSLTDAKQVSNLNPFQGEYPWGRATLVEYRNKAGRRLQGVLHYPAAHDASKKYPMVVYMYERLSDDVHRYIAPDDRSAYNVTAFTQRGYFVLQPDIVFEPREPGLSVIDCVESAVKTVARMGVIDASKVGITGHSWGGFDTVYLSTHSKMFAAGVAGAPITNLVSNYGSHHWGPGIAETGHIETGQQRMEVPLYEDLPAYIRNSAIFNVHNMTTPLLVMFGESDGVVRFHQGVELYNVARRAGKQVVLITYPGEDHGLRKRPNMIDYHRRSMAWFDHYLKGAPAERWITEGTTFLEKERA
ncbi:MAG: prolyl oligopeptidase family serine peptidase [Acidobacteriota bacterium]|nr:prolyl oligopeptidase family serine peptidase [Acidobacteriota bacterium]